MNSTETVETEIPPTIQDLMPSPESLSGQPSTRERASDEDGASEQRERQKRLDRFKRRIGEIPNRFRGFRFGDCLDYYDDPSKREATEQARSFASGEAPGQLGEQCALLLAGDFGTGKTVLATATYKTLLWKKDVSGRWMKWHKIVRDVQSTYNPGSERSSAAVIKKYQNADVLLIDDVGDLDKDQKQTADKRQILYEILDERHSWLRPTVFTTNLANESKLVQQWGERTFNRILEMAAFVEMGGANLRIDE